MKLVPLVLVVASCLASLVAQDGADQKARLPEAVAAAQKAYDAGDFDAADDALRAVASAVHDDFKAVMLRSRVNFALAEFGKAATYAQRAAELDPKSYDAHMQAGLSLFQQAEATKSSALNSGTRVAGFYESAITEFEAALKITADDPVALLSKARCLFWLDRVPDAITIYEQLRKIRPQDPEPCLYIAQAHLAKGNADGALKVAVEGLVCKDPSTVRGDLAQLVFGVLNPAGKYPEMTEAFKAWTTAHPSDPQAWLWLGYTRFMENKEKNQDEALAHYQKGFEVSGKKHGGCALEAGNLLVQKGELAKAAEWYGLALRAQPEWPDYNAGPLPRLSFIAAQFVNKRDFAKALELLETNALPAGEYDWNTMNNLGLFYRDWADSKKGPDAKPRNEKSLAYYLKASKLVVDDPSADGSKRAAVLNDTGVIYHYNMGNMEKGLEYYREALQHDPKWKDALENVGVCFNLLGKYEEAIPMFEKVLEQEPARAKSRNGLAEARKAVLKDQKPTSR
jgi:tetratricopeptide (TPR) repeat protein